MHAIDRFAQLALDCVCREFPNKPGTLLRGPEDLASPKVLTPVFYGCFDWHSAVHGHWLLAVTARTRGSALAQAAQQRLVTQIVPSAVAAEVAYLRARPSFERPYGLAWLLQLHAELATSPVAPLSELGTCLEPLADTAADHLCSWLPKLSRPIRSGVHSQTAFGLCLALDWAEVLQRPEAQLFRARALDFYREDVDLPGRFEPDGEDFLSPSLGTAELMARVLEPTELAKWLDRAIPDLGQPDARAWLTPCTSTDPSDGRLAHLDGLNLARAWCLVRLARSLPPTDQRLGWLYEVAEDHEAAGLAAVSDQHYAGSHWLGSFAVKVMEERRATEAQ